MLVVATTVGTVLAYLLVPMRSLGQDSWKIAAALMGRHIGGGNLLFSSAKDVSSENVIVFVSWFVVVLYISFASIHLWFVPHA